MPPPSRLLETGAVEPSEKFDQFLHDPGPPRLVAGADASVIVAVKILEEQKAVAPVWIGLESL
jgi:hypothetical protein